MKYKIHLLLLSGLLSIVLISCKKEREEPVVSSLILVNAVPGSAPLAVNFTGTQPSNFYSAAARISYGILDQFSRFNMETTEQPLALYQYPDTLSTSKPLFNLNLHLEKGSINSLFLMGTVAQPDYLFLSAVPPYHAVRDSTFGIRFVNLSYQSKPVNVYLIANGERKEIDGLAYKGITPYKNYTAFAADDSYVFEFRDQETQNVIASYVLKDLGQANEKENLWRYRNFTMALIGLPDTAVPEQKQKIFLINNY